MKFLALVGFLLVSLTAIGDDRPPRYIQNPELPRLNRDPKLEQCLREALAVQIGASRDITEIYGPFDRVDPSDVRNRSRVDYVILLDHPRGAYTLNFVTDDPAGWETTESGSRRASRMYPAAVAEKTTVRGPENEGPEQFYMSLDRCEALLSRVSN